MILCVEKILIVLLNCRQPVGACPPVRPYVAENLGVKTKRQGFPQGEGEGVASQQSQSKSSWSPQPFRMASESPTKNIRRETFVSSRKETFDESVKENISSPRRDTFIVPKGKTLKL